MVRREEAGRRKQKAMSGMRGWKVEARVCGVESTDRRAEGACSKTTNATSECHFHLHTWFLVPHME